jgi:two-component system CheB/CheR fusion protein
MIETTLKTENAAEAGVSAENIVDTIRESLLVLDGSLQVLFANNAFYRTFHVSRENTIGRKIYDLGNGQWDIPALRQVLEKIIPKNAQFNDFSVEHDFETIGKKSMLLNGRRIDQGPEGGRRILLTIERNRHGFLCEGCINHKCLSFRLKHIIPDASIINPSQIIHKPDYDLYPVE